MATMLPQFMLRRAARRAGGSDLTRMADQYRKQVESLASQYETDFGNYQRTVAEKMAPYEAEVEKFRSTAQPQYQAALADYSAKLADYQRQLEELAADPVTERIEQRVVDRTWYGRKIYGDVYFYDPKPAPVFNAKPPEVPNAPVAPEIPAFDTSQFDAKRQQLSQDMTREVAERRGSRINALRRGARTMLMGKL